MPRKTKDAEKEIKNSKANSSVDKKASTSKKSATKTKSTTTKKSTTSKKSSLSKQAITEKRKKDTVVSSGRRGRRPLQNSTVKSVGASIARPKKESKEILEYYDLPYRYNETTVKILAQTPKKLFIYWDISEEDRKSYIDKFGPDFFNNTIPVLIVHNTSMNYTFEVEINDFANCWYLDINDAKCEYSIELGRRSKIQSYYIPNNYVFVTASNKIENPNDHILFEKQSNTIYFRNVKTNSTYSKDIANLSFIRNMGKIYNIYDAYKKLYNKIYSDEDIIDINNPSSNNPTSTFK